MLLFETKGIPAGRGRRKQSDKAGVMGEICGWAEESGWEGKRKTGLYLLVFAALAVEVFGCNFSAWKSLFYGERFVFEQIHVEGGWETAEGSGEYVVEEGALTLHVEASGRKIHNLFFAVDFPEGAQIPYTITLTDEGNYYPYSLPEGMLVSGIEKSFYTDIYPSGRVGEISVQFLVPAEIRRAHV